MIEVQNLTKDYGQRRAIDNLNFKIEKGSVVGFLGPNGAGKSTTMKIITGFMAPSSGVAKIAGFDVFENPIEVKKRIGYLPETPPVYGDMFVQDYLKYVARLKSVEAAKIDERVQTALEKTNLISVRKRLIQNLSKGFKQRVGIAQAIVSDPEVLILDEPTVGLDPKQVAEIRQLILDLRGQHTIILSTHILSEVQAVCEKAIIIHQGRIVAEDSIQNLAQLEKGKTRLKVRTHLPIENLSNKLLGQSMPILACEDQGDSRSWQIELNGDEANLARLSLYLSEKGGGILEFTPARLALEDVFLRLTYGSQPSQTNDSSSLITSEVQS